MAIKKLTDIQRFHKSYEVAPSGCWQWRLSKDKDGYGLFRIGGMIDGTRKQVRAHRWAYKNIISPFDDSLTIDHLCRNHGCVNPSHLEPVSGRVNTQRGERATATHCKRGHPFSGENLMIQAEGKRRCRICSENTIRQWQKNNPDAVRAAQERYNLKRSRGLKSG